MAASGISAGSGRAQRTPVLLAVGLVVAALIYVGFSLVGRASLPWVLIEAFGALPFALLAWLGVRRAAGWLALGWAAHAAWDLLLHTGPAAPGFVPGWYPVFCTIVDVIVAAYILAARRRSSDPASTTNAQ